MLRDWLNRLLEGQEASATHKVPRVDPEAPPSTGSSTVPGQDQIGVKPDSSSAESAGVSISNTIQPPGPPEHWLRLIREGAPGLLRSSEGSGVPSSTGREITGERDASPPETPSGASLPYSESAATVTRERPSKDHGSAFETAASGKRTLLQALIRRIRRAAVTQGKKERAALREGGQPLLNAPGISTQFRLKTEPGDPPPYFRALHQEAIESVSSVLPKEHAVPLLSGWRKLVQQKVQAVFPIAFKNRSASKGFCERRNEEAIFPEKEKPSERSDVELDRVGSRFRSRSLSFEWPSVNGCPNPAALESQKGPRSISALQSNAATWVSLPTNAMPVRDRSPNNSRSGTAKGEKPSIHLPASQMDDVRSFVSVQSPGSEQVDPWPELPEDPHFSEPHWRESLRSSDRLRALDLEQRGGR
jgi:hypothetical protein